MKDYDRDYYIGTISALTNSLSMLNNIIEEMSIRIEELEDALIVAAEQDEDAHLEGVWNNGVQYGMWKSDKTIPNTSTGPKLCMCDECWGIEPIKPGLDTIEDVPARDSLKEKGVI